jgi:hypothetical protein
VGRRAAGRSSRGPTSGQPPLCGGERPPRLRSSFGHFAAFVVGAAPGSVPGCRKGVPLARCGSVWHENSTPRTGCRRSPLDCFAEVAAAGQAAGDDELATPGPGGERSFPGFALRSVRGRVPLVMLADLADGPGGETIT